MKSDVNANDWFAIQQVLARYCRGIDRLDRELLEAAYWEDGFDDHVLFAGKPADFISWVLDYLAKDKSSMHMLGQSYIELDGTQARAETYFTAQHVREDESGDIIGYSSGRYLDVFEKRGDEWRIFKRFLILDIRHRKPLGEFGSMQSFPVANVGCRGRVDGSYKIL
jgi:hypothetical protein